MYRLLVDVIASNNQKVFKPRQVKATQHTSNMNCTIYAMLNGSYTQLSMHRHVLPADRWDTPPGAWKLHQTPKFYIFPLPVLTTPVDFDHHEENFEDFYFFRLQKHLP